LNINSINEGLEFIRREGMIKTTDIKLIANRYIEQGSFAAELLQHLEGTARLAQELAAQYGQSPELGYAAGYWHDISRGWSDEQSRSFAVEQRLDVDTEELAAGTSLLHGHIAARLWQDEIGNASEWQHAIACHTLGTANPTLEDQIIGVADFAAYDRTRPLAAEIRRQAFSNLSKAYLAVYAAKIKHVLSAGKMVHPQAQSTVLALQRSSHAG
jgi:HD superfamily phosphohydrolase YqeK